MEFVDDLTQTIKVSDVIAVLTDVHAQTRTHTHRYVHTHTPTHLRTQFVLSWLRNCQPCGLGVNKTPSLSPIFSCLSPAQLSSLVFFQPLDKDAIDSFFSPPFLISGLFDFPLPISLLRLTTFIFHEGLI